MSSVFAAGECVGRSNNGRRWVRKKAFGANLDRGPFGYLAHGGETYGFPMSFSSRFLAGDIMRPFRSVCRDAAMELELKCVFKLR